MIFRDLNPKNWTRADWWGIAAIAFLVWGSFAIMASSGYPPHVVQSVHMQDDASEHGLYWYDDIADIPGSPVASITRTANLLATYTLASGGVTETNLGMRIYQTVGGLSDYIVGTSNPGILYLGDASPSVFVEFLSRFNGVGGFHTDFTETNVAATSIAWKTTNSSDSDAETNIYGDGTIKWSTSSGSPLDVVLEPTAAGTLSLTTGNLDLDADLNVDGEFTGARAVLNFGMGGGADSFTTTRCISHSSITDCGSGWTASRAGSIVGLSVNCDSSFPSGSPTLDISARINGTNALVISGIDASSDVNTSTTQARSSGDDFAIDDVIQCYGSITGTVTIKDCLCGIEVQLDS